MNLDATGTCIALYNSMEMKKIAIPVYRERVAPLFDVAGTFLIADIRDGEVNDIRIMEHSLANERQKISFLKSSGINLVICSAISRQQAVMLLNNEIDIIPGVIGETGEILIAFCNGKLNIEQFTMPGCRWRRRNRNGRCPYYSEIIKKNDYDERS